MKPKEIKRAYLIPLLLTAILLLLSLVHPIAWWIIILPIAVPVAILVAFILYVIIFDNN